MSTVELHPNTDIDGSRYPEYVYAAVLLAPSLLLFLAFVIGPMFFGLLISVTNYDILAGSSGLRRPDELHGLHLGPAVPSGPLEHVRPVRRGDPSDDPPVVRDRQPAQSQAARPARLPDGHSSCRSSARLSPWRRSSGSSSTRTARSTRCWERRSPSWSQPEFALLCLSIILIWTLIPLNIVFYLAALQGSVETSMTPASIDGAGGIAAARHITWPLVLPTTVFVTVINITAVAIGSFDIVYVLTKGGPQGSTTTVVYLLYRRAFVDFDLPSASALGFMLALLLLLITRLLLVYE